MRILFLFFLLFFGLVFILILFFKSLKKISSKNELECVSCEGSGKIKQDVHLIMTQASLLLWMEKHLETDKCSTCSKNQGRFSCKVAKLVYNEKMSEYKKIGPRLKMLSCPHCKK